MNSIADLFGAFFIGAVAQPLHHWHW